MDRQRRWMGLALRVLILSLAGGCVNGPPPTQVELGEEALARGDWRNAEDHFVEALHTDTPAGRAWHGLARAQIAGRDPESALRSLGSLAKVDPAHFKGAGRSTYANALEGAAASRLAHKRSKAALDAARALSQLDPERRGLNRLLGNALLGEAGRLRLRGDPKAAFALYEEASRVVPHRLEGWLGAAEIMIESNRGKAAVRFLEAARKFHPTSGEIRMLSIQAISAR